MTTTRTRPRAHRTRGLAILVLLLGVLAPAVVAAPASARSSAARSASAWTDLPESAPAARRGAARDVDPSRFRALGLKRAALADVLDEAPKGGPGGVGRSTPLTISLPAPDGRERRFAIRRTSVLAPALAAENPGIATYAGVGIDDRGATVHLDLTPSGFHASVRGPEGSWYVDPRYHRDQSVYASYRGADLGDRHGAFSEGQVDAVGRALRRDVAPRPGDAPVPARTYRLALLNDPAYADFVGGTPAAVVAAKATLIDRVNQVYEDDLAILLELIAGTGTTLNLDTDAKMTGPDGPCGEAACYSTAQAAGCDVPTLDRTRTVLGILAGAGTYDVGHLALAGGGGGIAYLGVVGDDYKGGGCTGVSRPVGDLYAVDYVSHEIGHQFGAEHTFNGTVGTCGDNISDAAVEPGSGSTIMGYAGICGSDDLQPHSDPYFSQKSIGQITEYADAATVPVPEGQSVSLGGFGGTDSFRLTSGGDESVAIVRGTNYTRAAIAAAVASITGVPVGDVVVTSRDDERTAIDDEGFHVRFDGSSAGTDFATLGTTALSGATASVSESTRGGTSTNGGAPVATTNRSPLVTPAANATIPPRTPFALTGSATDADGDALTYLWEQTDAGTGTGLIDETKLNGPLFRVFGTFADVTDTGTLESPSPGENAATTSPTRAFPDLAQVVEGTTNQAGGCAGTAAELRDCRSEFLPTAGYAGPMHFRLTARDGAGGVAHADTTVALAPGDAPFQVTQPAGGGTVDAGDSVTVAWDRAGTDGAPVNAANVRITLSVDGGATFPRVLAASTPNDGSEAVVLRGSATTTARVRVEAVGNVFFDVSPADFTIVSPLSATRTPAGGGVTAQYTDAPASSVTVSAKDTSVSGSLLQATATGLPAGLSLTATGPGTGAGTPGDPGLRAWSVTGEADAAPGTYPVVLTVDDGEDGVATTSIDVVVTTEDAAASYTGDTEVASAPGAGSATATLRADVSGAVAPDATAGDVSAARVTFREGTTTLCADVPVVPAGTPGTGSASCPATLSAGAEHPIAVAVGGRYAATAVGSVRVIASPATTTPTTPTEPTTPAGPVTPTTPATPTTPGGGSRLDPGAGITPLVARLRPVLTATARRLRPSRTGRVPVRIGCRTSGAGTAPATCRGTLRITATLGGRRRTAGTARFAIATSATRTVRVRLGATARRLLRRTTTATVTATVTNGKLGTRRTTRSTTLVPRR